MKKSAALLTPVAGPGAAALSKGERKLVRTLYKALVCSARTFETEPALKALVFRRTPSPLMLTSPALQEEEAEAASTSSSVTSLMDSYYDDYLGSRATRFYHPDLSSRSLLDIIRDRFRRPLPSHDELEQHLDAGFQVVKELESALALGRKIALIESTTTPNVAASGAEHPDKSTTTTLSSSSEAARPKLASAAAIKDIGPGMLLVPHPLLQDPFWQHTVILLLSHSPETGAIGTVINRPESRLFSVGKGSRKKPATNENKRLFKGFYGGPVGLPELYWLSKAEPTSIPPSEEIMPGLYHGKTMAIIDWNSEEKEKDEAKQGERLIVEGQDLRKDERKGGPIRSQPNVREEDMWSDPNTKFFFGHAAWVPEQLEGELQEGTWFVAKPEGLNAIFPDPPLFGATTMPPAEVVDVADREKQSRMWGDILKDMGGPFAPIAKFASLPRRYGNSRQDEDGDDDES